MDDATPDASRRRANQKLTNLDALLAPPPPEPVPVVPVPRAQGTVVLPSTCDALESELGIVHVASSIERASPRLRAAAWLLFALPAALAAIGVFGALAQRPQVHPLDVVVAALAVLPAALYWPVLLHLTRRRASRPRPAPRGRPQRRDAAMEAWLQAQDRAAKGG